MLERLCSHKRLGWRNTAYDVVPRRSSIEFSCSEELAGGLMDSKGTEIVASHCTLSPELVAELAESHVESWRLKAKVESIDI